MTSNDLLSSALATVDRWRHLPGYRLEPRADFLFAAVIPKLLEAHSSVVVREPIIPEFPVRRGSIYGPDAPGANKSVKIDYVVAARDQPKAFLIELKTDAASRRDQQDEYLQLAKDQGLTVLLQGILDIVSATSSTYLPKYVHLLHYLQRLGWLSCPDSMYDGIDAGSVPAAAIWLPETRILPAAQSTSLEIVYVQPHADTSSDAISFESAAAILEAVGDVESSLFASYLRRWTSVAGHVRPEPSAG